MLKKFKGSVTTLDTMPSTAMRPTDLIGEGRRAVGRATLLVWVCKPVRRIGAFFLRNRESRGNKNKNPIRSKSSTSIIYQGLLDVLDATLVSEVYISRPSSIYSFYCIDIEYK